MRRCHNRSLARHIIHPDSNLEVVLNFIPPWAAVIVYHVRSTLLGILMNLRGLEYCPLHILQTTPHFRMPAQNMAVPAIPFKRDDKTLWVGHCEQSA